MKLAILNQMLLLAPFSSSYIQVAQEDLTAAQGLQGQLGAEEESRDEDVRQALIGR